jgi:hypothetical protein
MPKLLFCCCLQISLFPKFGDPCFLTEYYDVAFLPDTKEVTDEPPDRSKGYQNRINSIRDLDLGHVGH